MRKNRNLDVRENVRVVTKNSFITAYGLELLTLKELKLLYIVLSQPRMSDKGFYEYILTPLEFSNMMGITPQEIYKTGKQTQIHLQSLVIECENKKTRVTYNVFSRIEYISGKGFIFRLNKDMTSLLLNVSADFSQPLLHDFMRMGSTYTMRIWHLFQREMKSIKPYDENIIKFSLSLDEIRRACGLDTTGLYKKYQVFRVKILDKAIEEIRTLLNLAITYEETRTGHKITGLTFTVINESTRRMIELDQLKLSLIDN